MRTYKRMDMSLYMEEITKLKDYNKLITIINAIKSQGYRSKLFSIRTEDLCLTKQE